jgi:hypothetical protein
VNESISSRSWVWSDAFSSAPGWVIVAFGILFVVTLMLWVFLPFAIYGTKSVLREQSAHLMEIRQLVKQALVQLKSNGRSEADEPGKPPDT